MASVIPKQVKKAIVDAWLPAAEAEWKVCLLTSAFPNTLGAYTVYEDLTNEVPNGSGYTTEGATITGRATAYVDTYDAYIDADNVSWPTATFANVRYAVVYETTNRKIRGIYDLGAVYSVTSGTFTLQWNTAGLIRVSSTTV